MLRRFLKILFLSDSVSRVVIDVWLVMVSMIDYMQFCVNITTDTLYYCVVYHVIYPVAIVCMYI